MPKTIVEIAKQELTFENVLAKAMNMPTVKINRATFLRKELKKYVPDDVITEAIRINPAKAGISKNLINKISMTVINYETAKVAALSIAASIPSSGIPAAAIGATAVDITSYFASALRIVQELAYLYGFEQFDLSEDNIDSETLNFLLIFLGAMFGVKEATLTLKTMANTLAPLVAKKVSQQYLTKGTIYPIIKRNASSFIESTVLV